MLMMLRQAQPERLRQIRHLRRRQVARIQSAQQQIEFCGLFQFLDGEHRGFQRFSRHHRAVIGEQQMLAIGRALMTRPRLLMLDEPSQGIMPKLVDEIFQAVKRIRDAGMTVLIVEQRMAECLDIADRAYILQTGRVLMQGAAAEIKGNPDVRKAYLGL